MRTGLLMLVLLGALPAFGASLGCPSGALTTSPLTATGATPNTVNVGSRSTVLVFQSTTTAGTATVEVDICCVGTCDPVTGTWAQVTNSPVTLGGATLSAAASVLNPTCQYRANVTACASCSVTVAYACGGV